MVNDPRLLGNKKEERKERKGERKRVEDGPLMEVIEWPWSFWLKVTKGSSAIRMNVRIYQCKQRKVAHTPSPKLKVAKEFGEYLSVRPRSHALCDFSSTFVSQGPILNWKETGQPEPPAMPWPLTQRQQLVWLEQSLGRRQQVRSMDKFPSGYGLTAFLLCLF